MIWLHTFGTRFIDGRANRPSGVPQGRARVIAGFPTNRTNEVGYDADAQAVRVGSGLIGPVQPAVGLYEVSGMQVIRSWLDYRKLNPTGRHATALDNALPLEWPAVWTTELLELIWTLEELVVLEPEQGAVLTQVLEGELMTIEELEARKVLPVPESARDHRSAPSASQLQAFPE